MQEIWNKLYNEAKRVLNPRKVSDIVDAGGVSAAIEAGSGKIYVGVCVDSACTLGICAERNAIFNMITNGESTIKRVATAKPDRRAEHAANLWRRLCRKITKPSKSCLTTSPDASSLSANSLPNGGSRVIRRTPIQ